jgi:hypothetical protein
MRPVALAVPMRPEDITRREDPFHRWRWMLSCDDGSTVPSEIRIYRSAAELVRNDRRHCDPEVAAAVDSRGRTVIKGMILDQEDPCLNWVVHIDVILEDSTPAA